VSFGLVQFLAANYISVPLTDILAALVSAAVVVVMVRGRRDRVPEYAMAAAHTGGAAQHDTAGFASSTGGGGATADEELGDAPGRQTARDREAPPGDGVPELPYTRAEVVRAYAPYAIIVVLFVLANLGPAKAVLAEKPWSASFAWPGLHVLSTSGKPVTTTTFMFGWLPAAGTLLLIAGILTAIVLRIPARRALVTYGRTYAELKWAIVTVMAVLALAYVMNMSGQTASLGAFLARAGAFFAFLSPIVGWIGVAVTGSDTSSNALFGALQVQTAARAGLDPLLLAAANSSGGVLGKMISPQNLAIAAGAVGMAGREGDIFRRVFGWSLVLLLFMCVLVVLQATPVLGWMVP
jgi:lactate permease